MSCSAIQAHQSPHTLSRMSEAESWVAIDFETANSFRGSPCSVGMVAVENGEITDRMTTLIRPPEQVAYFEPFNTQIHGITASMVQDAPPWKAVLERIMEFAAGRPLIAHNAAFDMGVLRDACTFDGLEWPELRYTCSLVVARQTWRSLSYSLPTVAEIAGTALTRHHEADADATAAAMILQAAISYHGASNLTDLLRKLQISYGRIAIGSWRGSHTTVSRAKAALPNANPDADPDGALYGLNVCITGTLTSMTRLDAQEALAKVGGQPVTNVTKKTDVLVIATPNPTRFVDGASKSSKHSKAEELLVAGHDIELIGEADFLERLRS